MANLLDYLDWRGDLTLAQAPFNEVDNLILSELSLVDFSGIVPGLKDSGSIPLYQAADAFFQQYAPEEEIDMGVLIPDAIPLMLEKMAGSPRFGEMKLSCFETRFNEETTEQFAALAIDTGDGAVYFSFRGTDDTLAGWKEDFHMTYMPEIPAQKTAVEYITAAARQFPRKKLRLGGHSKGGNLAIWASVFCPTPIQKRILSVWSNDGPGFHADILSLPQYTRIADRIFRIIPKSSIVGMLLEHDEDYIVVDSSQQGLMQHDGFSWEVLGTGFVQLYSVTESARLSDLVLKEWMDNLTFEQRESFIDGLFQVLTASGAQTLTDLKSDKLKAAAGMVKAMTAMDKQTKKVLTYAIKVLLRSNLKILSEELQADTVKQALKEKLQNKQKNTIPPGENKI